MNKRIKILLIVFAITLISLIVMLDYVVSVANADDRKPYKLFEDGVTYIDDNMWGYKVTNIIHEGKEIGCHDWSGNGGSNNPRCLEIILRSLP